MFLAYMGFLSNKSPTISAAIARPTINPAMNNVKKKTEDTSKYALVAVSTLIIFPANIPKKAIRKKLVFRILIHAVSAPPKIMFKHDKKRIDDYFFLGVDFLGPLFFFFLLHGISITSNIAKISP